MLYDVSAMKYLKADINSSTESIGRQNTTTRSLNSDSMKLVKQDGGSSNVTPISFEVVKDKDEKGNAVEGFNGDILSIGDVIDQDAINGKLDKVYVTDDYTFVSYVTVDVEKLMQSYSTKSGSYFIGGIIINSLDYLSYFWDPAEDYISLHFTAYDEHNNYSVKEDENVDDKIYYKPSRYYEAATNENDGVSLYDTHGYYTNLFRQSFIIDNNTGLIYSVGERSFFLQRGVAIDSKLGPVSIKTNDDGTLKIEQLIPNSNVAVKQVFKDKYDQYYIRCDIDEKMDNILFFTKGIEYVPTRTGEVIHFIFPSSESETISKACVIGDNFVETPLTDASEYDIYYSLLSQYSVNNDPYDYWWDYYYVPSDWNAPYSVRQYYSIRNGKIFFYKNRYIVVDIPNYNNFIYESASNIYLDEETCIQYDNHKVAIGKINADTSDYNKWTIVRDSNAQSLKYNQDTDNSLISFSDLLDDVNDVFISYGKTVFRKKNSSATIDYLLEKNKLTGEYEAVEEASYIAEKQSLTLQPINR